MPQTGPASVFSLIEESFDLEQEGRIGSALQRARRALRQARISDRPDQIAAALVCVAHVHFRQGHYDSAQMFATESLDHSPADAEARADALQILGLCAAETNSPDVAEEYFHQTIDLSRQIGYRRALRSALHNLSAMVYVPRGQFELALAADEESLRLALELDMPEVAWFPLATMGWVCWVTGQRERALALAEELHGFAVSGSLAEGFYYCLRADLALDGETPDSALPLYARARAVAESTGDPGLNVLVRLGLSRYQRAAGNVSAACHWANDALTFATRVGYQHLRGWALIDRGHAAWEAGDLARAESDLVAAIDLLAPMQASYDLARANFLLAALLHHQQSPEADSVWVEAVTLIVSGGYAFLLEREQSLAFPLLAEYLNSEQADVAALSNRLLDRLMNVSRPALRIYTLGRFYVQQGQRAIPDKAWRQRKAGELFRFLLLSYNRTALRDQIIHALWPEKSPRSAQSLFHQATSCLRRALEPDLPDKFPSRYLCVDGGQVALCLPKDSWIDFEVFETHIAGQDWQAALECYRGKLYPGDLYADWAAAPRERLKHSAIRAALAVAKDALEAGRYDQALNASRRALALEPWQEEAVLLGMKACVAQNDRAGAIRLYQTLDRMLGEELGIAPQEDLQGYYRSVAA
ncbi:MAG: hypothetical protein H6649_07800 [Caldilineae bacterium]|nr:hypothetical protein [Caldilineae bacterium]